MSNYTIIPYDEKYRDDMIFMVLEAKDALGRIPRLNEDLLDIQKNYLDTGDMFWLAIDENDRVIGCVGYNAIPGTSEVRLHRLYIKAALKRQGIGTHLLQTVEQHLRARGKTAAHVHLGGKEYFESRSFYPKQGYREYAPDMMMKKLKPIDGGITVRKIDIVPMVTDDDRNGKGYVHWKSWHETYTGLIDPAYMEKLTLEKCVDMAHRWPDNILVAKDGDNVVGFVGYGKSSDDTLVDCGEVFAIYVLTDYHGQKIGYDLMNAAFEKLADYKKIAVWVLKGNDRAIKFYERYGFRFDGTEKEIKLGTSNTEVRMVYTR